MGLGSVVTVVSVAVIAVLGAFLLWWVYAGWLYEESKFKKLLPDSALAQPVLDSPEGKAFLARYPNSETVVQQDFNLEVCCYDCCYVTFDYVRNETQTCISDEYGYECGSQGPGARFQARIGVSPDLKNIGVVQTWLFCSAEAGDHPGHWTVKGDIVENLQPENPECWDIGPPPRPSDAELIEMAKNTTVGKAYVARFPDNKVSFDNTNLYQERLTFNPTISEPVQFVVNFDKDD